MKRVLITGIAGFIGSNLAEELYRRGYEIGGIDNFSTGKAENLKGFQLTFFNCDIRDKIGVSRAFNTFRPDYVFHLAALARIQPSIIDPVESHDVNATGTLNILWQCKKSKVKRVIYSASSSVYGNNKIPYYEDQIPDPLNPYAVQKYFGELYCKMFSQVYGLDTVCPRFFNVYGPKQATDGAYATVIGIFLKQKSEGKPMTIVGDGKQKRDFTHIKDIADGLIKLMECEGEFNGDVFNLGTGKNIDINKLAELIGGQSTHIDSLPQEAQETLANNNKAKLLLGWSPEITIEEGIKALI